MPERRAVEPAAESVCAQCPWRTTNHGKRHPDGWYTKKRRAFLWSNMRRGEAMTCHPTDPDNPVPEGVRPVPEGTQTRECAGALILQQREFTLLQEILLNGGTIGEYRKQRSRGLTRDGAVMLLSDVVFGGTPLGGREISRPNLHEPVSMEGLPWDYDRE